VIVLETILRRWYVFAFLAGYFATSVPERGWRNSLRFAAIAFGIAFAAEYTSTRTGFPFTSYRYTADTHGDEMYLSNVPLFVPLSYAVMISAGRSVGSRLLEMPSVIGLVAAGAVCTMAIDVVVDPIALRGGQWFLGDLYRYDGPGQWFGVPLGNFGGWLLVSMVVIAADLLLSGERTARVGARGISLAAGVVVFNAGVGLAIGAVGAVFASLALCTAILVGVAIAARLYPFGEGGVVAVRPEHARRERKEG
jgi:putative membrane protein